ILRTKRFAIQPVKRVVTHCSKTVSAQPTWRDAVWRAELTILFFHSAGSQPADNETLTEQKYRGDRNAAQHRERSKPSPQLFLLGQKRICSDCQRPVVDRLQNHRSDWIFRHVRDEGKNKNNGKNRKADRQQNADKSFKLRCSINSRGFFHAGRNRVEIT